VGLDFVHQELIGWLWFATAVVSCEWKVGSLCTSKHIIREEQRCPCKREGMLFRLKITKCMVTLMYHDNIVIVNYFGHNNSSPWN